MIDGLSEKREGEDQKMATGERSYPQLLIADMIHMWWSGKIEIDGEKVLING